MTLRSSLLLTLLVSQLASADWYFRGTPNQWAATALDDRGQGVYATCQTFAQGDGQGSPRFKIDRFANWAENYPSADYEVSANSSVEIRFNALNQTIDTVTVANCDDESTQDSWYFRGTANGWSTTAMLDAGQNNYEVRVSFAGEANNARFKIDHRGDWIENYPNADIVVADFTTYDIRFNSVTKTISVAEVGGDDSIPAQVSALPSPGTYSNSQRIRLQVSDNKDAQPRLYFTLDGSQATQDSALYVEQIFS
ncbi:chitobiase/beta-hexosaminidase C-terminal domain-containing protein, partial [Reinekea forsetii]|nr:chitobiase/beta-hexosaminidase C-terminal domain-containing protein [Reinekea forsetii]